MKKIIITGGAGYIGNELIKALPQDVEIVVIDNFHIDTPYKREINAHLQNDRNMTLIEANIGDTEAYKEYLAHTDVVVYMASLNVYKESNSDPAFYLNENALNLQSFLSVLHVYAPEIKKLIVTSSRGVYGEGAYYCKECSKRFYPMLSEKIVCTECLSTDVEPQKLRESDLPNPSSIYGLTKKLQEDLLSIYAQSHTIPLDVIRIFNVFGEEQGKYYETIGIVPQIFEQITGKKQLSLYGNGDVTRDFVHVKDVVKVLHDAIHDKNKRKNLREVYNLGSGIGTSITDIADCFTNLGYEFKRNYVREFSDIQYSVADTMKITHDFGIDSLSDVISFIEKHYRKTQHE